MHGKPPERHWVRQVRSIEFWGIAVPLLILCLAWPTRGASLSLGLGLPAARGLDRPASPETGNAHRKAWLWAWACYHRSFSQCHRH